MKVLISVSTTGEMCITLKVEMFKLRSLEGSALRPCIHHCGVWGWDS